MVQNDYQVKVFGTLAKKKIINTIDTATWRIVDQLQQDNKRSQEIMIVQCCEKDDSETSIWSSKLQKM